jgi:hypothetical protein
MVVTLRIARSVPAILWNPGQKTFGDAPFALDARTNSSQPISYSIVDDPANTAVIQLNGPIHERVSIMRAGVIKLRATLEEDENHFAVQKDVLLTILQAEQFIHFQPIADVPSGTTTVAVSAVSNSGLPLTLEIVSGPASITTNELITLAGVSGEVHVRASSAGNENYLSAVQVDRRFSVLPPTPGPVDTITELVAYPVPATDFLNIDGGNTLIQKVRILDLFGREKLSQESNVKTLTLDVRNLSSATYVLVISTDDGAETRMAVVIANNN